MTVQAAILEKFNFYSSRALAWMLASIAVAVVWIGGDLWPWMLKPMKPLQWESAALGSCTSIQYCVTGFMKWLVSDEAYLFPWTFKEFTRTLATGIEIPI